jgi:ankyrin repeat protein
MSDAELKRLVRSIVTADDAVVLALLATKPTLVRIHFEDGATRQIARPYHIDEIGHYIYSGDTALHIAAASYREEIARKLIVMGADVRARNRRGAEPLHYAVDGTPGSHGWNPDAQAATVACLIEAGADSNAVDKNGVTPLHRAVRTRCAAAVKVLLEGGADPRRKNKNGSTPMLLATQNTGRGGSGSREAKAQQERIVGLLQEHITKRT